MYWSHHHCIEHFFIFLVFVLMSILSEYCHICFLAFSISMKYLLPSFHFQFMCVLHLKVSCLQAAYYRFLFYYPTCHSLPLIRTFGPLTFGLSIDSFYLFAILNLVFLLILYLFFVPFSFFFLLWYDGFVFYSALTLFFWFFHSFTRFRFMVTLVLRCVNPLIYLLVSTGISYVQIHFFNLFFSLLPHPHFDFDVLFYIFMFILLMFIIVKIAFTIFLIYVLTYLSDL